MERTKEVTVLANLFLAYFFICYVNYIKIKSNNMGRKYLENNLTPRNVTACLIFWAHQ